MHTMSPSASLNKKYDNACFVQQKGSCTNFTEHEFFHVPKMVIMWRPPGCIFWTKELYLHPCAPLTSILILYRPNYVRESRRKSHIVATNLQATAAVAAASRQNHTVGSIVFWRSTLLSWNIPKNVSSIWRDHIFSLSLMHVNSLHQTQ